MSRGFMCAPFSSFFFFIALLNHIFTVITACSNFFNVGGVRVCVEALSGIRYLDSHDSENRLL